MSQGCHCNWLSLYKNGLTKVRKLYVRFGEFRVYKLVISTWRGKFHAQFTTKPANFPFKISFNTLPSFLNPNYEVRQWTCQNGIRPPSKRGQVRHECHVPLTYFAAAACTSLKNAIPCLLIRSNMDMEQSGWKKCIYGLRQYRIDIRLHNVRYLDGQKRLTSLEIASHTT